MSFTIDTHGLKKLRKRLQTLAVEVHEGAEAAVTEAGEAVKDDMEARVPVDKGDLRKSLRSEVNKGNLVAEIGPRGRDVYYGYFQEFGTSTTPAQPFAGPAHEAERKRFPARMKKHVRRKIK